MNNLKPFLILKFLLIISLLYGQKDTTIYLEYVWETKNQVSLDSLIKPKNIAQHAHLYISEGEGIINYFWVEYSGMVDSVNQIHKFKIYDDQGSFLYEEYYFLIDSLREELVVNFEDYELTAALSRVTNLKTNGKLYTLYSFHYPKVSYSYKTDLPQSIMKDDFQVTSSFTLNNLAPEISKYLPDTDVLIKAEKIEQSHNLYKVTIWSEEKGWEEFIYVLESKNKKLKSKVQDQTEPLLFKYLLKDDNSIYLLDRNDIMRIHS